MKRAALEVLHFTNPSVYVVQVVAEEDVVPAGAGISRAVYETPRCAERATAERAATAWAVAHGYTLHPLAELRPQPLRAVATMTTVQVSAANGAVLTLALPNASAALTVATMLNNLGLCGFTATTQE